MFKFERFDKEIMSSATYYETLDYVADYVQRFLNKVFGEEIPFPVSADILIEKLEIPVEKDVTLGEDLVFLYKPHGTNSCQILIAEDVVEEWILLKCIARYLLMENDKDIQDFALYERPLRICLDYETLVEMMAYEIMLPWKQAMKYLTESSFLDELRKNRARSHFFGDIVIGEIMTKEMSCRYKNDQIAFAYRHVMQTIEAKAHLKHIENDAYKELVKHYMD